MLRIGFGCSDYADKFETLKEVFDADRVSFLLRPLVQTQRKRNPPHSEALSLFDPGTTKAGRAHIRIPGKANLLGNGQEEEMTFSLPALTIKSGWMLIKTIVSWSSCDCFSCGAPGLFPFYSGLRAAPSARSSASSSPTAPSSAQLVSPSC